MKIKTILSGIGSVILTIFLWLLQMLPNPNDDEFKKDKSDLIIQLSIYIWDKKEIIGISIACIAILLIVFNNIILYKKPQKIWLKVYMDHIMKELFSSDYENTRITIFKVKYGYKFVHIYMYRAFMICLVSHWKDNLIKCHIQNIPIPWRKYIYMYSRCSNPHQNGSSTFFPIANEKKEISGIASDSIYSKKHKIIETEAISSFFDPKKAMINDYSKSEQNKIKKYLAQNNLEFNKIRCLHRLSNHLYAEPIYDRNEQIWGVFIVDIESSNNNVFEDKIIEINRAVRVISLSLNHFK